MHFACILLRCMLCVRDNDDQLSRPLSCTQTMHPAMDSTTNENEETATVDPPALVGESGQDTDEIIARYEEMFASRYTAEDAAYQPYINKGMDPPPVIENYHIRRQRQNWNDNSRDQRHSQDRGHRRSYGDAGWRDDQGNWKRQYDNRSYQHQGGGWGHHQGNQGQQGGPYPPQDWRRRDGQDHGSQPYREREYDSRDRGRYSGSQEHRSQGRDTRHSHRDEWT